MKKYIFIALAAVIAVSIYSCKKKYDYVAPYVLNDSATAFIKIVDASAFFRNITGKQDTFNIYVNGQRLTSAALSFGGIFPVATTPNYAAIQAGPQQLKLSIPGVVNYDSAAITSFNINLKPGKYYSLILTDSLLSVRDSSRMLVQDVYSLPLTGYNNLRFAHAVINDTATKTVDVFSYARNATIFSKIKPDSITSFQVFGFNPGVPDTFYITRTPAVATTPLAQRTVLAKALFSPVNQRTYTIVYKGDGNLTTGTKARSILSYSH